jgi:hypothetical protein
MIMLFNDTPSYTNVGCAEINRNIKRKKGKCIVPVVPDDAKRFSESLGDWLAMAWH